MYKRFYGYFLTDNNHYHNYYNNFFKIYCIILDRRCEVLHVHVFKHHIGLGLEAEAAISVPIPYSPGLAG